jgi:hypothetical protein
VRGVTAAELVQRNGAGTMLRPAELEAWLIGRRLATRFRRRASTPAVDAAGVQTPATPYDLRDTFASNAPGAAVTVFELAKIMGTSVRMIERHYGALIDRAHAGITSRLDALEAQLEQAAEASHDRRRDACCRYCQDV